MANEAVCIEAPTKIVRRTIGGAITKGTILKLTDPNTAAASSADNDVFAGIAIEEVTSADYTNGVTEVGAAIDGVFDLKDSGAGVTAGAVVNIGGANQIIASQAADLLTGSVVGVAEETAGAGEVIRVRLRGY